MYALTARAAGREFFIRAEGRSSERAHCNMYVSERMAQLQQQPKVSCNCSAKKMWFENNPLTNVCCAKRHACCENNPVFVLDRTAVANAFPRDTSVLFLGSSVDRKVLQEACRSAHAKLHFDPIFSNPQLGGHSCKLAPTLHVAYMLQFGAGEPPYWAEFSNTGTGLWNTSRSEEHARINAPAFAKRALPTPPDLVLLSSDLWDLSNWWRRAGKPQDITWWPAQSKLRDWCVYELPAVLSWVAVAFPNARVVLRTPPTMSSTEYGRSPALTEVLATCIRERMPALGYTVLDYRAVVDQMLEEGAPVDLLFGISDPETRFMQVHPGTEASLRFMNLVINHAHMLTARPAPLALRSTGSIIGPSAGLRSRNETATILGALLRDGHDFDAEAKRLRMQLDAMPPKWFKEGVCIAKDSTSARAVRKMALGK